MRWMTVIVLLFTLGFAPLPADAQARSLDQAVRMVQQQTDGRILSAEQTRRGNRIIYRIKVLTPDGRVRVITVDGGRAGGNDDGRGGGRQ